MFSLRRKRRLCNQPSPSLTFGVGIAREDAGGEGDSFSSSCRQMTNWMECGREKVHSVRKRGRGFAKLLFLLLHLFLEWMIFAKPTLSQIQKNSATWMGESLAKKQLAGKKYLQRRGDFPPISADFPIVPSPPLWLPIIGHRKGGEGVKTNR